MKQIYVCEKCGAQYDDWNAAVRCEDSHRSVQVIERCDLDEAEADALLVEATKYRQGCALPDVIPVKFHVHTDNGGYATDENGQYIYESALYALVKTSNAQREMLEKLDTSMTIRRKHDYEESERWRKEWEAKQAAKAAQDSEVSE